MRRFTTGLRIQPCSLHIAGQEKCPVLLFTAKLYGFNDQIKRVGTLSSISFKKTSIYILFNKQPRQERSHGKMHCNKRAPQPGDSMSTLLDLVDMTEKPEGVRNINTKLFFISFPHIRSLQELSLESTNFDYSSVEYRVTALFQTMLTIGCLDQ